MIEKIEIAIVISGIISGLMYVILFLSCCFVWLKIPLVQPIKNNISEKISIIIAARNEEKNILNCLEAIAKQNYSKANFEIIVVDDHSDDETFSLLLKYAETKNNIKILQLQDGYEGKKEAIELGIENAKNEIIVTTDADCVMNENWLQNMVSALVDSKNKMIVGPVMFYNEKKLLEKFQSLEMMALGLTTAASLYFNKATLCNGANLAYYKSTFNEVGKYKGIKSEASGDDVLLMYKINSKYANSISFLKSSDALVFTKAKKSLNGFYSQRKRWASKKWSLLNFETKMLAFIVLSFNFILIAMLSICGLRFFEISISKNFIVFSLILLAIKWLIDFLLLFLSSRFYNKKHLLIYFLPEQLFYSLYLILIAVFAGFGKFEWKGRKIK